MLSPSNANPRKRLVYFRETLYKAARSIFGKKIRLQQIGLSLTLKKYIPSLRTKRLTLVAQTALVKITCKSFGCPQHRGVFGDVPVTTGLSSFTDRDGYRTLLTQATSRQRSARTTQTRRAETRPRARTGADPDIKDSNRTGSCQLTLCLISEWARANISASVATTYHRMDQPYCFLSARAKTSKQKTWIDVTFPLCG